MNAFRFNGKGSAKAIVDLYKKQYEKEQDALLLCGSLLGDCYMLGDATYGFMVDAKDCIRHKKWFRFDIKKAFNESMSAITSSLVIGRSNSASSQELIMGCADAMSDGLSDEYFKMWNGCRDELYKLGIKDDNDAVAHMLCVDIMFQIVKNRYDGIIQYMTSVFPGAYYDSWYKHASLSVAGRMWGKFMELYVKNHMNILVDANNIRSLDHGWKAIVRRFRETIASTNEDLSDMMEHDAGVAMLESAIENLGLRTKEAV